MDKKQQKLIRLQINKLLDSPSPNWSEIERLGKLIGSTKKEKEITEVFKKPRGYKRGLRRPMNVTAKDYIEMKKKKNMTWGEIANHYGITLNQLESEIGMLRKKGEIPKGVLKIGAPIKAKMTKKQYYKWKEQRMSDRQIAKKLGIHNGSLILMKKKLGIPFVKVPGVMTKEEYLLYKEQGLNEIKIAEMKKIHRKSLYRLRKEWGLLG